MGMVTNSATERAAGALRIGVLAGHLDGFSAWLWECGYSPATGIPHLRVAARFGRWLDDKSLGEGDVDEEHCRQFLRHRRRRRLRRGDWAALRLLLRYLREAGIITAASTPIVDDESVALEQAFGAYLLREKGVSPSTEVNYRREIRAFLHHRFRRGSVTPSAIRAHDLHRFVLARAQHVAPSRAKLAVTALRAFSQFLRLRGDVTEDLTSSALTVPRWRLSTLPKSISPEQVERILAQCDRRTVVGRRNYAILLVLARLGLRAGEVVALTVDDVDWDAGEVVVRGKGLRHERIPLPHDVGQALAVYLRAGRPRCSTRHLFVRMKAPRIGFASPAAISTIVADAIAKAKLDPPSHGAHLLRYSLATHVLQRGGSLAEVAELLRHRHPDTTALYAKVDLDALRSVAPPWPGVGR
jgi:site-specific recombinase XerD